MEPLLNQAGYGQSQNSPRDLANSLVVNKSPKVGKGEKKEEVDPKKLVSKKSNDTTFSGSLNDIGLDWTADKMGKPHVSGEGDSKQAKQSESADKNLKASKSSDANAESQSKEQKSNTSKPDEKSAEKEKAAASNSGDDHNR